MLGRVAILLGAYFALSAFPVFADPTTPFSCMRVLVEAGDTVNKQREFWNRTEPITVNTPRGPKPFALNSNRSAG